MIYCKNCNTANGDNDVFCAGCGARLADTGSYDSVNSYQQPQNNYQQPQYNYQQPQQYAPPVNVYNMQSNQIPLQYQPLSPWAYLGYELLFSLPIIGFILLIIFSFSDSNINRRNFARSYFCLFVIIAIIIAIIIGIFVLTPNRAPY